MPDQPAVTVSLDINLDTPVEVDHHGYGDCKTVTLGEAVVSAVADKVYTDHRAAIAASLDKVNLRTRVEAEIDRLVAEKLSDVLVREFVPTDPYGQKRGEPTSLAAMIEEAGKKWLESSAQRSGYATTKSNFRNLVDEQIGHAFTAELRKTIDQAKADATKVVRDQAAAVIAETIARAAKANA